MYKKSISETTEFLENVEATVEFPWQFLFPRNICLLK